MTGDLSSSLIEDSVGHDMVSTALNFFLWKTADLFFLGIEEYCAVRALLEWSFNFCKAVVCKLMSFKANMFWQYGNV